MDVDTVIMSLGTSPNPLIRSTTRAWRPTSMAASSPRAMRARPAARVCTLGGDAVTGAATVIKAMGAGKAAAKAIDEYIQNK